MTVRASVFACQRECARDRVCQCACVCACALVERPVHKRDVVAVDTRDDTVALMVEDEHAADHGLCCQLMKGRGERERERKTHTANLHAHSQQHTKGKGEKENMTGRHE